MSEYPEDVMKAANKLADKHYVDTALCSKGTKPFASLDHFCGSRKMASTKQSICALCPSGWGAAWEIRAYLRVFCDLSRGYHWLNGHTTLSLVRGQLLLACSLEQVA